MNSPVLAKFNYKKLMSGLKKRRRRAYPKCSDSKDLDRLLKENPILKKAFGQFRGKPLYRETLCEGTGKASMFIVDQVLKNLDNKTKLFMDGTFGIVPLEYKQLLILFGEVDKKPRPFCFVLMTNKKKELYKLVFPSEPNILMKNINILKFFRKVFDCLRDDYNLKPGKIMSDFEDAMRFAAIGCWPSVELKGCWFHFGQSVLRNAKSFPSLAQELKKSHQANRILTMFQRLALLPPDKVQSGLDFILEYQRKQGLKTVKLETL
jgi:hypothetical protein